jgi:hypothetical protein
VIGATTAGFGMRNLLLLVDCSFELPCDDSPR